MKCSLLIALLSLLFTNAMAQSCHCGIEKSTDRIVGGTPVKSISRMPWMAMITSSNGGQFCGGALISSRAVLTAAHCMEGESSSGVKVVIGVLRTDEVHSGNLIGVRRIVNHPRYDSSQVTNDISILILDRDINLNDHPPVCIEATKRQYGQLCIPGWGDTYDGSNQGSTHLLEVCFYENDFKKCNGQWGGGLNANTQLTAGGPGKDSCQGDSGGPLYTKIRGRSTQVGVVSYGGKCGQECAVYTRVSGFYSWIQTTITSYGGGYQCSN